MKQYEKIVNKEKAESTGYTQEMISIRNQAIANGTFMKAPNGKPTNLNERQWLQVRTKAFKDWFGDWESVAARIANARVIWGHPGIGKTEYYKNNKNVIDFDSVYKHRINKELGLPEGAEERKKWRREHRDEYRQKILSLFDEAVKDAEKQGKQLLVSDMVVLQEREDALDLITQMSEDTFAKRSVQRNEPYDNNKKLWKTDIDESIAKVSDKSKVVNTEKYLSELYEDAKNVSKVVDENGEPLVVYHGSDEKFTTFDVNSKNRGSLTSVIKKGFYFSNKNIASQYASSKFRNDYFKLQELKEGGFSFEEIAEAFGANIYDDESMDRVANYLTALENETVEFNDNLYAVFLNIRKPVEFDLKGNIISTLSKEQKETINSSEGAILKNVDETTARYRGEITTPGMYIGTDYIVFNPNQIKSATDNIEFSKTDNDIYHSEALVGRLDNLLVEWREELQNLIKSTSMLILEYIMEK